MPEKLSIFLIYLFYGAVFFAIGVAITSRHATFSKLKIAGFFWLFALFAFLHGFHEWLELFLFFVPPEPGIISGVIEQSNLLLVAFSFLFLFLFGISLHGSLRPLLRGPLAVLLLLLVVFSLFLLFIHKSLGKDILLEVIDYELRKIIGFPATLLAGSGFFLYARSLRNFSPKGASNFTGAGGALIVYGLFAGLVPSGTKLLAGLPVEVWRGGAAFVILHFLMNGMDIFLAQREALIAERLNRAATLEKLGSLGRLAAGVAHEINNPLANVSLQLELLQQDSAVAALPEHSRKRLETIERNVDRSSRIARELLLFSSGRTGDAAFEPVDLRRVVDSSWELAGPRTRAYRLRCRFNGPCRIFGTPLKLEELFLNLFYNAMDAMPTGGAIDITGQLSGGAIVITVHDQGHGIPPENLGLVLEPFFTSKEVGQGTGLGLAICYGIMELHCGTIAIASPPEEGTTITLTFPAKDTENG